jgi:hypothetical protein
VECAAWESQGRGAEQSLLSSPGEEKKSPAGKKGTFLPRARGRVKVTENGGGNGNK